MKALALFLIFCPLLANAQQNRSVSAYATVDARPVDKRYIGAYVTWDHLGVKDSLKTMVIFDNDSFHVKFITPCDIPSELNAYVRYGDIRNYCLQEKFVDRTISGTWKFDTTQTSYGKFDTAYHFKTDDYPRLVTMQYTNGKTIYGIFGQLNTGPATFNMQLGDQFFHRHTSSDEMYFLREYYYEPLSNEKIRSIKERSKGK